MRPGPSSIVISDFLRRTNSLQSPLFNQAIICILYSRLQQISLILKCENCFLTLDRVFESSQHLRLLNYKYWSRDVMFYLTGTAQEARSGVRSGSAGIPVHGSMMGRFSLRMASYTFFWSTVAIWFSLWCC